MRLKKPIILHMYTYFNQLGIKRKLTIIKQADIYYKFACLHILKHHGNILSSERLPTRCNSKQAVQPQMVRGLKLQNIESGGEGLYHLYRLIIAKTKALISSVVTTPQICTFFAIYAKIRFPHNADL